MWGAVYFALTLVVEAGSVQRLIHRMRHAMKGKHSYRWSGSQYTALPPTESSDRDDVEAAEQPSEIDGEDEDVREERLKIDAGTLLPPMCVCMLSLDGVLKSRVWCPD